MKLPKLQFRLRTILVVFLLTALGIGHISGRARKQRAAVEWVRESGFVWYDFECEYDPVGHRMVETGGQPPGPDWLREWIGVDYFASPVWLDFGFLGLGEYPLDDPSRLTKLPTLQCVDFGVENVESLQPLSNLRDLRILVMPSSRVTDLSPLARLHKLELLEAHCDDISDLTPLSQLTNLRSLHLDVRQFQDLTIDERLAMSDEERRKRPLTGSVLDLAPLSGLENLEVLRLYNLRLSNLSTRLPRLRDLELFHCEVTDFKALSGLESLEKLSFYASPIEEIPPLAGLRNLKHLDLRKTAITDPSQLYEYQTLEFIDMRGLSISEEQLWRLYEALPGCAMNPYPPGIDSNDAGFPFP